MATPLRLVLDTNVCLDLFVFGDAQCAALREALRTGAVQAVTDEACRAEWLAVLDYPQLALDAARQAEAAATYDALLHLPPVDRHGPLPSPQRKPGSSDFDASMHESPGSSLRSSDEEAGTASAPRLPRCRDPDDQKFLELARACGAQWLLSRDRELLRLARRTRREHGFDIVTPQAWAQAQAGSAGAASAKPV
ncbi:PIN domain-containing protein [Rhodanobacter geophilus]|uniref:Toxin-antitoxin system toxin component, PIN family n=1 Tax=Rhodanobacter geophilus TaxID=3162488 RepID=A0ABV3QT63_9GAMM